jgi:hypothetical protein
LELSGSSGGVEVSAVEVESPRKKMFHRITGWCVLTVMTILSMNAWQFLVTR